VIERASPDWGEMIEALPDQVDWLRLTTEISTGNEKSFAFFYDRYFGRLFRYILVMTGGDEQTTRDLLQTTMLKAARYLKPISEETILWSWLTQLAKTAFIDHLRSRKRAPEFVPLELVNAPLQERDSLSDVDTVLETALQEAIKILPTDEQDLLKSTYFDRLSQKEIAASMGSTPKAVESKLGRIRQKLRKMLRRSLSHE